MVPTELKKVLEGLKSQGLTGARLQSGNDEVRLQNGKIAIGSPERKGSSLGDALKPDSQLAHLPVPEFGTFETIKEKTAYRLWIFIGLGFVGLAGLIIWGIFTRAGGTTCTTAWECYNLGSDYYYGHNGRPENESLGREFLKKSCDLGESLGCSKLGTLYADGGQPNLAFEAYKRSCDLASWECYELGRMYEFGTGVNKDVSRAFQLYKKSCDALATAPGCFSTSAHYMNLEVVSRRTFRKHNNFTKIYVMPHRVSLGLMQRLAYVPRI